jgi:DnaK suppressor protein
MRINRATRLARSLEPKASGPTMTLTSGDLQTLHARLRALRAQVGGAVSDRLHRHGLDSHEDAALPNRRLDTDDDAAAEAATSMDIVHVARDAEELELLDAALARVNEGEYGACVDCGEDIARERLLANPAAARCTECQERSERAALVARRTRS